MSNDDLQSLVNAVLNHQDPEAKYGNAAQRLTAMRDLAELLEGDTLTSLVRSLETLDRFKAKIFVDGSPFSLGWSSGGLVGGLIFHRHAREFSIHT